MKIEFIEAGVVHPGDTLVLTTSRDNISKEELGDLHKEIVATLPKDTKVVIIVGVKATVIQNATKETQ